MSTSVHTWLSNRLPFPPVSTHDRRGPPRMAPNLAPSGGADNCRAAEMSTFPCSNLPSLTDAGPHSRTPVRASRAKRTGVELLRVSTFDERARELARAREQSELDAGTRFWAEEVEKARSFAAGIFGEHPLAVGDLEIPSMWYRKGRSRRRDPLDQVPAATTKRIRLSPESPSPNVVLYVKYPRYLFEYMSQCRHMTHPPPRCLSVLYWTDVDSEGVGGLGVRKYLLRGSCFTTLVEFGGQLEHGWGRRLS
jgi:hypothetical protein